MTIRRPSKWLKLFESFIVDLRISSKEFVSEDERGVKLVLWESQKRFIQAMGEGLDDGVRVFNFLKGRQLGITSISLAIDVFWLAMHNNLKAALVTDTEDNRNENRKIILNYVKSFPPGYFGDEFKVVTDNRTQTVFSNGSQITYLVAGTKKKAISWAQGKGFAMAHMTEVGSYGDPAGVVSLEESFAQQNPDRLFIFESTAAGFNHWHERFMKGKEDPSTQRSEFLGWWSGDMNVIHRSDIRFQTWGGGAPSGEERELVAAVAHLYGHKITDEQLAWIRWKEANAGSESDLLQQNNPWTERQAFIQTGYSFFQTRELAKEMKRHIDNEDGRSSCKPYRYIMDRSFFEMKFELLVPDEDTWRIVDLKVWEEPVEGARYVIGFDVAYGRNDHGDKNAISVWRCFADRLCQVAEYATPDHDPKQATWVLAHLAGAYSDCIINHEVNGPGGMVITELEHLRGIMNAEMNEKIVRSRDWENALGNARWYLFHRPDSMGAGYAIGFSTTFNNKQVLLFGYRSAHTSKDLDIRSLKLLQEMSIVVQNGSEIGAPESSSSASKDDLVFAAALACKAWVDWVRPGMIQQGLTYERVMAEESGQSTAFSRSLNGAVVRFFQTMEERAAMAPDRPEWREARGL